LAINDRNRTFPGMIAERNFNIVLLAKNKGTGTDAVEEFDIVISFKGKKVVIGLYSLI